jgi:hypothetical protein
MDTEESVEWGLEQATTTTNSTRLNETNETNETRELAKDNREKSNAHRLRTR